VGTYPPPEERSPVKDHPDFAALYREKEVRLMHANLEVRRAVDDRKGPTALWHRRES
jgi:hypothetical protein